jgi:hypothetical protein
MLGDVPDFVRRQLSMLPAGWFGNPSADQASPTLLQSVLAGFATAWSSVFSLIQEVRLLTRITTASGPFLDMAAADFFGTMLSRRPDELDPQFGLRIKQELLRPRGTRAALALALTEMTGIPPVIFEPARPADTGGYTVGGVGYNVGGGWGDLLLNHALFVAASRPSGSGIAYFGGYGTGGYVYYGDLSMVTTAVRDADIYAAASAVLPAGTTAWMKISG